MESLLYRESRSISAGHLEGGADFLMPINPVRFIDGPRPMSQKIKTVIGNVLITVYCLYANIPLICREKIINLISIVRFIRATDASAICTWLFIGTAEKCCQVLIDLEAQKNLLKNHIFVICLLETSSNPFYKTYFRQGNIF